MEDKKIDWLEKRVEELDKQLSQVALVAVIGCSLAVTTFLLLIVKSLS